MCADLNRRIRVLHLRKLLIRPGELVKVLKRGARKQTKQPHGILMANVGGE
jgi:hypothetical protein